jgi:hypothetical protein
VGHRFAPISECEARVGLLRGLKGFDRLRILEVVQQLDALEEGSLGCRIAAVRERQLTELVAGRHFHSFVMMAGHGAIGNLCRRDGRPRAETARGSQQKHSRFAHDALPYWAQAKLTHYQS